MLIAAAHDVLLPISVGLSGADDAVHFIRAIEENRVCLSRNYDDYLNLHNLVIKSTGHHPGILIVRRDDRSKRNMSRADIVRAIKNLTTAGVPLADQYCELNPWQ
jgi:hypothetical protein